MSIGKIEKRGPQSYRIRYTDSRGLQRSEHYKTRTLAKRALVLRKSEVLRDKDCPIKTFDDLVAYYLEFELGSKKSPDRIRSTIRVHLQPFFGNVLLKDIDRFIDPFVKELNNTSLAKKTKCNILAQFGAMMTTAHRIKWITGKPYIPKPKTHLYEQDYNYLKTTEDINLFLQGAGQVENKVARILYKTAVYTGMRAGELAGLRREDINFNTNLISVVRTYRNASTKNGKSRFVPILNILKSDLASWMEENPLDVVFPNGHGNVLLPSNRVFQETMHRSLKNAGLYDQYRGPQNRKKLSFHDLRHTFASHWMMKRGCIFKLKTILGHSDIKMTQRYSHLNPDKFAADLDIF